MNRLILICLILNLFAITSFAQPSINIASNSEVVPGLDPWNGDLCLFECYPSKGAICFDVADNNLSNITVTVGSSNPLVVPINANNLRIAHDQSTGEAKLWIFPIRTGNSNITINAMGVDNNGDWLSTQYYIDLEVKECTNNIVIRRRDLDILPDVNQTFTFKASNSIRTAGNAPIVINPGDNIEFIAGNFVTINAGFEVKLGGEFLADIDDCK